MENRFAFKDIDRRHARPACLQCIDQCAGFDQPGAGQRFEGFAYFTTLGFSVATATLVGQRVGAGDLASAKRVAYASRTLITGILLVPSAVFVFAPHVLLGAIAPGPEALAHGSRYLAAVGTFTIFLGWELVFEGAFNGLGNTRPYMFLSVPLTLARVP